MKPARVDAVIKRLELLIKTEDDKWLAATKDLDTSRGWFKKQQIQYHASRSASSKAKLEVLRRKVLRRKADAAPPVQGPAYRLKF